MCSCLLFVLVSECLRLVCLTSSASHLEIGDSDRCLQAHSRSSGRGPGSGRGSPAPSRADRAASTASAAGGGEDIDPPILEGWARACCLPPPLLTARPPELLLTDSIYKSQHTWTRRSAATEHIKRHLYIHCLFA